MYTVANIQSIMFNHYILWIYLSSSSSKICISSAKLIFFEKFNQNHKKCPLIKKLINVFDPKVSQKYHERKNDIKTSLSSLSSKKWYVMIWYDIKLSIILYHPVSGV